MAPATVVHVLPLDLSRGAQTYARALRDALDGRPDRHRTLTLFTTRPGALSADVALDVTPGRGRRLGFDPRAAMRLRRALHDLSASVVIAHGGEPLKYVAAAAGRRVPIAYYKIGTAAGLEHGTRRALYRLLAHRAAVSAAVSDETAAEARQLLALPPERVRVIVNGRDPAPFAGRPRTGTGRARLLFVGHLTASKRPEVFLDLVERLRREGVRHEAAIAGTGPRGDELRARADALGVEMLGSRSDVPALLADADILVFTSRPEGEGMPGVLIEAGLAARPTVATAVAGAATVIEDGVTGYVVPVDDFEAMVARVRTLAVDPALRDRLGQAARARCEERFTLETSARAWQLVVDELLGRR